MNRLWTRLTLAFLLLVWLVIGAMALVVQRITETGFRQYLVQRDTSNISQVQIRGLQNYYAENGTWDGVNLSSSSGRGEGGNRGAELLLAEPDGIVVASTTAENLGSELTSQELALSVEIVVEGRVAGYVLRKTPGNSALGSAELAFLNEASRTLFILAAVLSAASVGIGFGLAWLLVRPLALLTATVRSLKSGKLGQQVHVRGSYEVTELAAAFNEVSAELAQGEFNRQRMAADIAHELRTPVSVLRGHLEAMRDGVFPLDQEHLVIVYDQTLYLARLVEDLRLLTLAQAGHLPLNLTRLSPREFAQELVESFQPLALDAEVHLSIEDTSGTAILNADTVRLRQVIGNLLTNALRHTPSGGDIVMRIFTDQQRVQFSVCNSGSTLDSAQIDHVFLPFWRASDSRERDSGGSGLGLAISKQLIELHKGRMWVESSQGSVCFHCELPLLPEV